MIFQKTLEHVLNKSKTQTSRIWKPDYVFSWSEYEEPNQVVLSQKAWNAHKIRKLYYVGQELSVQPNRGAKGIARIRVLELAKRDVRDFTQADIMREGFGDGSLADFERFLSVWVSMHDKWLWRQVANKTHVNFTGATDGLSSQFYTALVIRFELVSEAIPA